VRTLQSIADDYRVGGPAKGITLEKALQQAYELGFKTCGEIVAKLKEQGLDKPEYFVIP